MHVHLSQIAGQASTEEACKLVTALEPLLNPVGHSQADGGWGASQLCSSDPRHSQGLAGLWTLGLCGLSSGSSRFGDTAGALLQMTATLWS